MPPKAKRIEIKQVIFGTKDTGEVRNMCHLHGRGDSPEIITDKE
jgi:hypothetical protein